MCAGRLGRSLVPASLLSPGLWQWGCGAALCPPAQPRLCCSRLQRAGQELASQGRLGSVARAQSNFGSLDGSQCRTRNRPEPQHHCESI